MLHCNDIDGLMMDWLYGELDESAAAEVSGHVDACTRCQAEQAAFSRTRDLFRQLPDEEPAASLTAMLVREAALSAAPKPAVATPERESGGLGEWLSRLFRPLMHPAAAAVATLVLVAGVAGTLYIKGGDDQFTATRQEKAPAAAEMKPEVADNEARADTLDETSIDPAKPADNKPASPAEGAAFGSTLALDGDAPPANDRTADLLDATRETELRRNVKGRAQPKGAKRTQIAGLEKQKAKRPAKRGGKKKTLEVAQGSTTPGDFLDDSDDDEFVGEDSRGAASSTTTAFRGQRLGSDAWAENLEGRLLVAYKRDDCREAARIANDIRERNPTYYKNNTSGLEAVKKCRYYVNSERKRRSARARKAAAKKAKSQPATKTGASKKNAAPEPDEAVEVE